MDPKHLGEGKSVFHLMLLDSFFLFLFIALHTPLLQTVLIDPAPLPRTVPGLSPS